MTASAEGRPIAVIGATGRLGRLVVARLIAEGRAVRAVGRDAAKLARLNATETAVADLDRPDTLAAALAGAGAVMNLAHAGFTRSLLPHVPNEADRLVVVGSTRRFTAFEDDPARRVKDAEAALAAQDRVPWILLHPTMIYGAAGENNLGRIAALVRRFPVVPLPGGGRALMQPVHVDDVAAATVAALSAPDAIGRSVVVPGPTAVTYAELVRAVARALGRRVRILPVPLVLVRLLARLTPLVAWAGVPRITDAEVDRLVEDKAFDPGPAARLLGHNPRSLEAGLGETGGLTSNGR